MNVSTLTAHHFSEESLLRHIECSQFEEVVHAVFEHHTVTLCAFCCIDNVPCFLKIHNCRHFASYILALLHRINHHLCMVLPVCSNINQVNVWTSTNFLPSLFATAVSCGCRLIILSENLLATLYSIWVQVT